MLLNLQKPILETDILIGFWSNTGKLALDSKVCLAIESADKSGWDAASLSHTLDILLRADQSSRRVRGAILTVVGHLK